MAIDYCHSALSDTGTADALVVTFAFTGADRLYERRVQGTGSCSVLGAPVSSDLKVEVTSVRELAAVIIENTGGDALFIDEVEVFRDGRKILWDGRDNGGGWCLSTDTNDHLGGWESVVGGCQSARTFNTPA
ncbi:hypothetical protein ACPVPU_07845 [Sphingomonas sp. CJ99]